MEELPDVDQPVTRRGNKRIIIIIAAALAVLSAIMAGALLIGSHHAEMEDKLAREERAKAQARERLNQRAADKARRAEEQQMTEAGASDPVPVPPTEPMPAPAPLPGPTEEPSPADAAPSALQASEADAQESEAATEPAPEPTSEAATVDTPKLQAPEPQPASEPQQTAPNHSEKKEVHPIDVTNAAVFEADVLRAVEEGQYEMLAESLIPGIRAASQDLLSGSKLNYAAYRRSDSLMSAVELCVLIKTVGEKQLRELTQGREAGQGKLFMHWMLRDRVRPLRAFIRNFMAQEGDPENMAYSLRTFFDIWKGTPEQERARYLNPAIACSLLSPEVDTLPV